jgi:hypothetical protein
VTTLPVVVCAVPPISDPIAAADENPVTGHTRSAPVQTSVTRIVTIHKLAAFPILIVPATVKAVDACLATVAEHVDVTTASVSFAATLRKR